MSDIQVVQYSVQVNTADAIAAINSFKSSVETLAALDAQIKASTKAISKEMASFRQVVAAEMATIRQNANFKIVVDTKEAKSKLKALKDYTVTVNIDTTQANRRLDQLMTKLEALNKNAAMTAGPIASTSNTKSTPTSSRSASITTPSPIVAPAAQPIIQQNAQAASIQAARDRAIQAARDKAARAALAAATPPPQSTTPTSPPVAVDNTVQPESKKGGRQKKDRAKHRRAKQQQPQHVTQTQVTTAPSVATVPTAQAYTPTTRSVISKFNAVAPNTPTYTVPNLLPPPLTNQSATATGSTTNKKPAKPKAVRATAKPAQEGWFSNLNKSLKKVTSYNVLGPSMLDSGGSPALGLLKGLGLSYGIAGVGMALGDAMRESVEYDNIMRTTRNILSVHDKRADFQSRFRKMEGISRNVGVETKFTSAEVADATKFLAMAGYDVDAISSSIRTIADIALVGDTDLGTTADLITNVMTGYDIDPTRLREVADKMTMTFTKTNTTLPEIAEAYKYSASLLNAGGVSFDEATAAIGILGNAGIKGSQAGTTLRTILSNIIFPRGKKRAKAWADTGVKLYREDGSMRSILEIFKGLNAAGVDAKGAFGLFDKTAAQGAVALINHVDEWNEVVEKNFMSADVSRKLAEEKKTTIAGMWASLTSAFTEGALKAFEALQEPLKQAIGSVTEGLKSKEFKDAMLTIGSALLNVVRTLKNLTATMYGFYEKFKGIIDWWLETQIKLMPVLVVGRIIRGFSMLIANGAKFAMQLRNIYKTLLAINAVELRNKVKSWFSALPIFTSQNNGTTTAGGGVVPTRQRIGGFLAKYPVLPMAAGGVIGGLAGNAVGQAISDNPFIQSISTASGALLLGALSHPNALKTIKNRYAAPFMKGALKLTGRAMPYGLALGGGLTGAGLGAYLTDGNMIGTLVGGAVGSIGGAAAGKAMGSLLAGSFAIPGLGPIVAAATAIGTLGIYVHDVSEEANRGAEAFHNFVNATKRINGIDYSESASYMDRYYQVVYDKQLNINSAVEKHIQLIKERMGLQASEGEEDKNSPKLRDTNPEVMDGILKNTNVWGDVLRKGYNNILKPQGLDLYDPLIVNGVSYNKRGYVSRDEIRNFAFAQHLTALAALSNTDSEAYKTVQEYAPRLLRANSLEGFNVLYDELKGTKIPGFLKNAKDVNFDNRLVNDEDATLADAKRSYQYNKETVRILTQEFFGNAPLAEQLKSYQKILTNIKQGVDTPRSELQNFLYLSGVGNMAPMFGEFGSKEYMEHWGFKDGKWTDQSEVKDKNGNVIQTARTAEESRQIFMGFFDELKRVLSSVGDEVRGQFSGFLNAPTWDLGNTQVPDAGATTTLNGETYSWVGAPSLTPGWTNKSGKILSYAEMKRLQELGSLAGTTPQNNGGSADNKKTAYGSPYSKHNPTPKQVNVRIENLMNIEAIDLSNPDNVATIENIKSQLAQALVDVVHDFDKSFT